MTLPDPAKALAQALAAPPGLVALLDPADNPLSGGIADTPELLRTLVAARLDVPAVFAFLHDPASVAAAREAGIGATLARHLGATITEAFGRPVILDVEVERLTEGRFVNEGPMERGAPVDLGATCVLRAGKLRIICTACKESAFDPGFFALHGIDLGGDTAAGEQGQEPFPRRLPRALRRDRGMRRAGPGGVGSGGAAVPARAARLAGGAGRGEKFPSPPAFNPSSDRAATAPPNRTPRRRPARRRGATRSGPPWSAAPPAVAYRPPAASA